MPADAADFHLTWAVGRGTLEDLTNELYEPDARLPAVSTADIKALWSSLDELRPLELLESSPNESSDLEKLQPADLLRQDPLAYRDLEHGLLRLEALSQGGAAYADNAKKQLSDLRTKLSAAVERQKASASSRALAKHLGFATSTTWAHIPEAAHALPVAEYFGACSADLSAQIKDLWSKLIASTDADPLSTLEGAGESEREIARGLAETQLIIAAQQQGVASLWSQSPVELANVLALRSRAEQLSVPRRSDGVPGDERAHYYARLALEAADARRRLAEDVLFIGERNEKHYADLAADADELYDWTSRVMQQASASYTIHDVALAEAPYFAAWLCAPAIAKIQDRDSLVNKHLLGLIRGSRHLGEVISQPEKLHEAGFSPKNGELPFHTVADEVLKDHQALKQKFKESYQNLIGPGGQGPGGWIALDATLSTPLIPASERGKLLDKWGEVSANLCDDYFKSKKDGEDLPPTGDHSDVGNAVASGNSNAPLVEMQAWEAHPLVAILLAGEDGKPANEAVAWCENASKRVRNRLGRGRSNESDGREPGNQRDGGIFGEHQRLSRAARDLRAAAALGFDPGGQASDPVFDLRQFDIRQLLIWHGERAIEDFWGDLPPNPVDEPFFVRAATHYFNAALNLGTPAAAVRQYVKKLQTELEDEWKDSKLQPMRIAADPNLEDEATGDVSIALEVRPSSQKYPSGRGALSLRNESGRLLDFQFEKSSSNAGTFVRYPPPEGAQRFVMALPGGSSDSPKARAVSFFRGRVHSSEDFPLPTFKGIGVDYRPFVYREHSIKLSGDRPEQLSLVFILDCSDSMAEQSKIEAIGVDTAERMKLATDNFTSMLSDIVRRNRQGDDTRVGVRFFGHRLSWQKRPENAPRGWVSTLEPQTDYKGEKAEGLTPSEDVELVQELGRFDGRASARISDLLAFDSIKPWGETPLYLALSQALDDFNKENRNTRKSIIAITDGEDYQSVYNPGGRKPVKTTIDMLLTKWHGDKSKPPIHILGFDIDESQGEAARARANYERIAKETGGTYKEIYSGGDLLNHLREHLNVAGYIVKDDQGAPLNPVNQGVTEQAKLGTVLTVPNSQTLPKYFDVFFRAVPAKRVRIEGGEALDLQLVRDGATNDIVAKEYTKRRTIQQAVLTQGAGGSPSDFLLRVHWPVRREGAVEFPVSLQLDPSVFHFTPRPAETWLEVTPLSGTSDTGSPDQIESYVFYDTNFVPGEPVPVLSWQAIDWQDWTMARIQFWCKLRPTEPLHIIRLQDVTYREFQNVPEMSGVQLKVETSPESGGIYRVHVVENHTARPAQIHSLRVQFQTDPQLKPSRVRHQFDRKTGLATHSFEFPLEAQAQIESFAGSRIVITRADDIKEGALQISGDSAIDVNVQPRGGYHTTGAASNGQ
jgi:hypothetical protein